MDGSMLFDRWRQRVLPWGHIGATWRIWLNLCILRPTRVHNRNARSIGSAVFARMTAECPYTLQWFACFPLKTAPSHVGPQTSCNMWFTGPTRVRKANGNLIASAIFAWLTSVTDWQSNRPRYSARCGVIMRNYVGLRQSHTLISCQYKNNFATI